MGRADNMSFWIGKQYGHAIGGIDLKNDPPLTRDQTIGFRRVLRIPRSLDDYYISRMNLLTAHERAAQPFANMGLGGNDAGQQRIPKERASEFFRKKAVPDAAMRGKVAGGKNVVRHQKYSQNCMNPGISVKNRVYKRNINQAPLT